MNINGYQLATMAKPKPTSTTSTTTKSKPAVLEDKKRKNRGDGDDGASQQEQKLPRDESNVENLSIFLSSPKDGCVVKISSILSPEQAIWRDECVKKGLITIDSTTATDICGVLLKCDLGYRSIKTVSCLFANQDRNVKNTIVFLNAKWLEDCCKAGRIFLDKETHLNSIVYDYYNKIVARDYQSDMTKDTCICVHENDFVRDSEFDVMLRSIFDNGTTFGNYYIYGNRDLPNVLSSKDGLKELGERMNGGEIIQVTKSDKLGPPFIKGISTVKRMGLKQFMGALLDSFE